MNLEQLYEEMKTSLAFFGLDWGEMDKVTVATSSSELILTNGKKTIIIEIGEPE